MSYRKRVSKSGKLFLLNTINSISNQNRVTEEKEMWDRHFKSKRLYSKNRNKEKMPREFQRTISEEKRIRLTNKEEDSDRWGHDGYRELYPNEFHFEFENDKTSILSESDGSEKIRKHRKKHKKDQKHKSKKKHKKPK